MLRIKRSREDNVATIKGINAFSMRPEIRYRCSCFIRPLRLGPGIRYIGEAKAGIQLSSISRYLCSTCIWLIASAYARYSRGIGITDLYTRAYHVKNTRDIMGNARKHISGSRAPGDRAVLNAGVSFTKSNIRTLEEFSALQHPLFQI